jgi:hypothetical protein
VADWRLLCRGAKDVTVDGDAVAVTFANERRHRVDVRDRDDCYELTGIVARSSIVQGLPDVPLRAWRRNRATQLVGFRVDRRGRLVGEAWGSRKRASRLKSFCHTRAASRLNAIYSSTT